MHVNKLLVFLETYDLYKFCDILILGECHKLYSCNNHNIPGFNTYYDNASFNKFDGLIIYTKQNLNPEINSSVLSESNIKITKMNVEINFLKYDILALYRSPSSNLNCFLEDLNEYLVNQPNDKDVSLLIGDLNLNLLNDNDNNVNEYVSIMAAFGFQPKYREVTRGKSGTCLEKGK